MQPEYTFTRFEEACTKYPHNTAIVFLGDKFLFPRPQRQGGPLCHRPGRVGNWKRRQDSDLPIQLRSNGNNVSRSSEDRRGGGSGSRLFTPPTKLST